MLSLPDELHKRLVDEYRVAVTKMSETQSPNESLYYFSVFFGETVRVLNWYWDEELALVWSVLQHAHNAISARLQASAQGDRVVALSNEFFDSLTQEAAALVDHIEKRGDEAELCRVLARLSKLTYATTGNGFYLLGKGHFTL